MSSEKIKEEFDRIDLAKESYDKEYNRLKRLGYYNFLGFSLPYMFMFIIAFYDPLKLLIEKVQYLDIILTAFFLIIMFFFMQKASKTSNKRKKLKLLIGLSVEEELFYNIYNAWNMLILYKNEVNINRKDNIMTDFINSLNDIKNVLNNWNIGNISYLDNLYGDTYRKIKYDFNNLDIIEIKKGDRITIDNLHILLIQFNEYLCDSDDVKLNNIISNIDNLPLKPKITKDKQLGYIDLLYTQPKFFSFTISLIISSIFLMITLNYNLGIGAILTIMPTTFGISFQISYTLLKEPREKSDEHERKKTLTDQEKKVSMFRNSKKVLGRSSLLLKGHLEHLKEEGDKYHANNRIPMEINNITRHSSILSSIGNETEKEKIEPIIKEGNKYGEFTTTDEFLKFNKEIRKWADNANSIQIDIS